MQNDAKLSQFFGIMILSLVGNACAEYALLWYAVTKFQVGHLLNSDNSISFFYIGQALGIMLLSPLLAVLFDRFSRRLSSIALDTLYSLVLLSAVLLYTSQLLNQFSIFLVTLFVSGLSALHRSSVAFAALDIISSDKKKDSKKFVAVIMSSNMLGAAISGVFYQYFGFMGCMWFGILTFIPAIYSYCLVFDHARQVSNTHFIRDFIDGVAWIKSDKILLNIALSIASFNVVGAIVPAVMGISFAQHYGNNNLLFGPVVGVGLGLGMLLWYFLLKRDQDGIVVRSIIPFSILPCAVFLLMCIFYPKPISFILLYFSACLGSTFRNVTTNTIRAIRIPSQFKGRVNTIYTAILSFGQILGSLLVLPFLKLNFTGGLIIGLGFVFVATLISFWQLPQKTLSHTLKEAR